MGHLSPEQAGSLEKFKVLCAQKGYYRPAKGGQNASHDDETLLKPTSHSFRCNLSNHLPDDIYELGSLMRKMPLGNSKIQKTGGRRTE